MRHIRLSTTRPQGQGSSGPACETPACVRSTAIAATKAGGGEQVHAMVDGIAQQSLFAPAAAAPCRVLHNAAVFALFLAPLAFRFYLIMG